MIYMKNAHNVQTQFANSLSGLLSTFKIILAAVALLTACVFDGVLVRSLRPTRSIALVHTLTWKF